MRGNFSQKWKTVTHVNFHLFPGIFLLACLALTGFRAANARLCADGWSPIPPPYDGAEISGCAKVFSEASSWNAAKMKCVEVGAKLMEVNSPRENDFAGVLMLRNEPGRKIVLNTK